MTDSELLPMTRLSRCATSDTAIVLPPDLSYEEWARVGDTLARAEHAIQWWRGDWLRYGEDHFPGHAQALPDTFRGDDAAKQTLQNAVYVCSRFPPAERRPALTFSHHAAVAGLDPDHRRRLLDVAERPDPATGRVRPVHWLRDQVRAVRDRAGEIEHQRGDHSGEAGGQPGNADYLPLDLPITSHALLAIALEHLGRAEQVHLYTALLTQDVTLWGRSASEMILSALAILEYHAPDTELPASYVLAARRLAAWAEKQRGEDQPSVG